jgi:uncharacterized protein
MAKPVGPMCNLNCSYCFYLHKEKLLSTENNWRMSDEVLEEFIKQYIQEQTADEIIFSWQGGEPTLCGLDFFKKVAAFERKYMGGKQSITICRPTALCWMMHGVRFSNSIISWSD